MPIKATMEKPDFAFVVRKAIAAMMKSPENLARQRVSLCFQHKNALISLGPLQKARNLYIVVVVVCKLVKRIYNKEQRIKKNKIYIHLM